MGFLYGWLAAILIALASWGWNGIQAKKLDVAQKAVVVAEGEKNTLFNSLELNKKSLHSCLAVNNANAMNAAIQLANAKTIIEDMRKVQVIADKDLADIQEQENENRRNDDNSLHTYTEPLPSWADWLRNKRKNRSSD